MLPKRLYDGYQTFLHGRFQRELADYQQLAEEGQSPEIMVISCCDSRVSPESIFSTAPGELFVLRNVANLVPPCRPDNEYHGTSAALEYAVDLLEVKHIVVLGHGSCGGISAFARQVHTEHTNGYFIDTWMNLITPALERVQGEPNTPEYEKALTFASIQLSLENLLTFPSIEERVHAGNLTLHGAFFCIATGELCFLDPEEGSFVRV